MTAAPLGVQLGDRLSLDQTFWAADLADEHGLESLWVAEGRLSRDAISIAGALAARTTHVKIGTGVINNKSRNVALTAVTFKTLDELAPGRTFLGIGAWWEPIATMLGAPLRRPLQTMREYVEVLRRFFANETVTYHGEFVEVDGARFDSMYRENVPINVPIYLGAVGPRMLQLAGEIGDGVNLDFLLPPSYVTEARAAIDTGVGRRTDGVTEIDITQLIACSVDDDDPGAAIHACKAFLTLYLAQQPHIGEHCGAEPGLVERIQEIAGWPTTPARIEEATALVSDELVRRVTACGTTADAVEALERYRAAGVRCPVLSPLGNKEQTIMSLVEAARS